MWGSGMRRCPYTGEEMLQLSSLRPHQSPLLNKQQVVFFFSSEVEDQISSFYTSMHMLTSRRTFKLYILQD